MSVFSVACSMKSVTGHCLTDFAPNKGNFRSFLNLEFLLVVNVTSFFFVIVLVTFFKLSFGFLGFFIIVIPHSSGLTYVSTVLRKSLKQYLKY